MIEYVTHIQHATAKNAVEIVVSRPALYQPGDLLLAALSSDYRVVGSPPAGWVEIIRHEQRKDLIGVLCYKLAVTNEPLRYKWKLIGRNTAGFGSCTLAVFRGVSHDSPIVDAQKNVRKGKTWQDAPSVQGVKGGALVCAWFHDDPQLPLAPPGMFQLSRFTKWQDGHGVAYEILTMDGPTGMRRAQLNPLVKGGGLNMSFSVVIRPNE